MTTAHTDNTSIPQLFYQALVHVMHGNAAPMVALWSEQDDVTYCDPNGNPHQGHEALVVYWQRAARLNGAEPGSITARAELIMMQQGTDMICAVMAERIQKKEPERVHHMKAVATNIYRLEGQRWRMIHRHSGSPTEIEA